MEGASNAKPSCSIRLARPCTRSRPTFAPVTGSGHPTCCAQVHDAVRAGEPTRDWATLVLPLDPIAARLRASAQEPVTGPVTAVQGGA